MFYRNTWTQFRKLLVHPKVGLKYKSYNNLAKTTSIPTMAEHNFQGKPLKYILEQLEAFAPLKYAENWDNVGLLVDPTESEVIVKVILLTNDLTEDVVIEAVKAKAGLIITYHPNIFQGLKSVTRR